MYLVNSRWCFLQQPVWSWFVADTVDLPDCPTYEAIAAWSWLLFRVLMWLTTCVHLIVQRFNGRHRYKEKQSVKYGGDDLIKKLRLGCAWTPTVVIFLSGTSSWSWARPVELPYLQFVGAFFSLVNVVLFIWVHVALGSNWSPVPEVKQEHTLATSGPYGIARHPMYSLLFLWCLPITALCTMNWVLTLATSLALIEFWNRIPQEDAILHDLFGKEYEEYYRNVGALGPRFWERRRNHVELVKQNGHDGSDSDSSAVSDEGLC